MLTDPWTKGPTDGQINTKTVNSVDSVNNGCALVFFSLLYFLKIILSNSALERLAFDLSCVLVRCDKEPL